MISTQHRFAESGRARMHLVPPLFAVFQCRQNQFCSHFSTTPMNRLFLPYMWVCHEIDPELRNSHYVWIVRDSVVRRFPQIDLPNDVGKALVRCAGLSPGSERNSIECLPTATRSRYLP